MIDHRTLSAAWIDEKRIRYKIDPSLMESMIFALYLLEQLKLTGLDFIFKGGTSLILLLNEPKRFSIDIDIIVEPKVNKDRLEACLDKIVSTGVFVRKELDGRRSYQGEIPKAHYKFVYNSNFKNRNSFGQVDSNPEREILLDVLFAENHYPVVVEKTIETDWLLQTGRTIMVKMPNIDSILGDKLTTFAPNTTGIPYKSSKEKEIISSCLT